MPSNDSPLNLFWTPLLTKSKGKRLQAIGLVTKTPIVAGDQLSLHLADRTYTTLGSELLRYPSSDHANVNAPHVYLWPIPRPAEPSRCRVTFKPRRVRSRQAQMLLSPARPMTFHVIREAGSNARLVPPPQSDAMGIEELCRSVVLTSVQVARSASQAMAAVAAGCQFIQLPTAYEDRGPDLPELFWWKLPDGRRVLSHQVRESVTGLSLPSADYPYRHWPIVSGSTMLDQIRWIAKHFDAPTCRLSRPEEYIKALIRDHGHKLPVLEGDLVAPCHWQHRSCAQVEGLAQANHRRDRERLTSTEIVRTMAARVTGRSATATQRKQYDRAYQQLTTNGKTQGRPALGSDLGSAALSSAARQLASSRRQTGVLLFNVAGWARGGLVRIDATDLPAGEFELVDPTTGGQVLYLREGRQIEFIAPPVPACGYLFLEARPVRHRNLPGPQANWDQRQLSLHFEHYVLQFHTAGGMCRWHDRARSMQWCSNQVDLPMGTCLIAPLSREGIPASRRAGKDSRTSERESHTIITPHIGALRSQVIVEADCPDPHATSVLANGIPRYRTTFTLYRGQRDLHVRMELLGRQWAGAAGDVCGFFPLNGNDPFMLIDRIAHLVEPSQDFMGSAKPTYMAVHRGIRIECKHAGVNFYPLDTPLIGFGAPDGILANPKRAFRNGVLYPTLMGNCAAFVLRPTGNDEWDGGLARGGLEVFRPMIATVVHKPPTDPARSVVRIEPDLVHLVAMKPAQDGKGLILRLWSADPDPLTATVSIPNARRRGALIVCDLLERHASRHGQTSGRARGQERLRLRDKGTQPGDRIPIDAQGRAKIAMRPHEIVTLFLPS